MQHSKPVRAFMNSFENRIMPSFHRSSCSTPHIHPHLLPFMTFVVPRWPTVCSKHDSSKLHCCQQSYLARFILRCVNPAPILFTPYTVRICRLQPPLYLRDVLARFRSSRWIRYVLSAYRLLTKMIAELMWFVFLRAPGVFPLHLRRPSPDAALSNTWRV